MPRVGEAWSGHTSNLALLSSARQMPCVRGSVEGLVGPVSASCEKVRQQV